MGNAMLGSSLLMGLRAHDILSFFSSIFNMIPVFYTPYYSQYTI